MKFTPQLFYSSDGGENKTVYLPSGETITATTEIQNNENQPMTITLVLKNEDDLKYFESTRLPAITLNETGGGKTKTSFSFELVATTNDETTAEGKTIEAELVFRRSEAPSDPRDFKRVPVVIVCNSPPPDVQVQIVRNKTNDKAALLVSINETQSELFLRHRDLAKLHYKTSSKLNNIMYYPSVSFLGFDISFDSSNALQIENYTQVKNASDYETILTGSSITITESSYIKELSSQEPTRETTISQTILEDSVGLASANEASDTQEFPKLQVTLTDKNLTTHTITPSSVTENKVCFLKHDDNKRGSVIFSVKAQSYSGEADVSKGVIKYQEPGGQVQTLQHGEVIFENQTTKTFDLWVEAQGYFSSEKQTYTVTLQDSFYVSNNGDGTVNGFSNSTPTTMDNALTTVKTIARYHKTHKLSTEDNRASITINVIVDETFSNDFDFTNDSYIDLTIKGNGSVNLSHNNGFTVNTFHSNKVIFENITINSYIKEMEGSHIVLANGAKLNNSDSNKPAVTIGNSSSLTMKQGSTIQSIKQGVLDNSKIKYKKPSIIMEGGTIQAHQCVSLQCGDFTMKGGNLIVTNDPSATTTNTGVYLTVKLHDNTHMAGTFTMTGGTIQNQTAPKAHAVFALGSTNITEEPTVHLQGGSIKFTDVESNSTYHPIVWCRSNTKAYASDVNFDVSASSSNTTPIYNLGCEGTLYLGAKLQGNNVTQDGKPKVGSIYCRGCNLYLYDCDPSCSLSISSVSILTFMNNNSPLQTITMMANKEEGNSYSPRIDFDSSVSTFTEIVTLVLKNDHVYSGTDDCWDVGYEVITRNDFVSSFTVDGDTWTIDGYGKLQSKS